MHLGLERRSGANEERSDADRTTDLVRRQRQHVDTEFTDVERNLSERGDRVGVNECAVRVGEFDDGSHRLNRAELVIRNLD